jgi:hypothetical protein
VKVYLLHHVHVLDDCEDAKLIGVYSSEDAARAAVGRLDSMPGFSDFPKLLAEFDEADEGFTIEAYDLDEDATWSDGFATFRDGDWLGPIS